MICLKVEKDVESLAKEGKSPVILNIFLMQMNEFLKRERMKRGTTL